MPMRFSKKLGPERFDGGRFLIADALNSRFIEGKIAEKRHWILYGKKPRMKERVQD
jgi:hypothetical protein